jgi:CRP-like cAMP-binding protein
MLGQKETDFREVARHAGTVLSYRPGDTIFREGEPATAMFVLLSGQVSISAHGHDIEVIGPGQALGILSLLDGAPRSSTATASEPSQAAMLEPRRFRFMVEEQPHFVWYVMGELAHRLRMTNAAL